MEAEEFRHHGKALIDFMANYIETIEDRRVTPTVEPGYLKTMIPPDPPKQGERWEDIVADIEPKIMVGVSRENPTKSDTGQYFLAK